jgi:hypothetical protein
VLKKTFIRFIPHAQLHRNDQFLRPVRERILQIVKERAVVFTIDKWVKPVDALICPRKLHFNDKPLFTNADLRKGTLQPYEFVDSELLNDKDILNALGCHTLDEELVCSIISSSSFQFSEKSYEWVAHLSGYLYQYRETLPSKVRSARFLLLNTGKWSSMLEHDRVYRPLERNYKYKPAGIQLAILDAEFYDAMQKHHPASWFLTFVLKLQTLHDRDIMDEIITLHEKEQSLETDICLNHTQCLAQAKHLTPNQKLRLGQFFHVVDQAGNVKLSKDVLIDWNFPGNKYIAATTLSTACGSSTLSFLNQNYRADDQNFLRSCTKIQFNLSDTTALSVYMNYLAPKQQGNNLLLYYLADRKFASFATKRGTKLCNALGELDFICESGSPAPMSSCYLRTSSLSQLLTENMSVLQIEGPDDQKWSFLADFGVTIEPSLPLYLRRLRLQKSKETLSQEEGIENRLYKELVRFIMISDSDMPRYRLPRRIILRIEL